MMMMMMIKGMQSESALQNDIFNEGNPAQYIDGGVPRWRSPYMQHTANHPQDYHIRRSGAGYQRLPVPSKTLFTQE